MATNGVNVRFMVCKQSVPIRQISSGMCIIGALLIIQVTLSFIGVLMCGDCCSGERAVGLFAYIFTMIGKNFSHSLKIKYLFQFQVWPLSSVFQLDPWLLVGLTLLVIALGLLAG